MGLLNADMKRIVSEQRLGFVATVCPDGTPNLSPKGTTAVWDDDHLVFANIRSPGTLANLHQNPSVEVNVVDPFARRGYRFKGVAIILESGTLYDEAIAFYRQRGVVSTLREIVLVKVHTANPVDSPAYDVGLTEEELLARWESYYYSIHSGRAPSSDHRDGGEVFGLDHVQLALPPGQEAAARSFYSGVLGLSEEPKPPNLATRGGVWFRSGALQLHLGVDPDFHPATKAHPALLVRGLGALETRCRAAGFVPTRDEPLEGFDRVYVTDPFGNRIELLEPL